MSIEFILRHEYAYRILNLNFQSAFFIDDQSQTSPSFNYTWYERISRSRFFYRGTTRSWLNQFSNWPFSSLFFFLLRASSLHTSNMGLSTHPYGAHAWYTYASRDRTRQKSKEPIAQETDEEDLISDVGNRCRRLAAPALQKSKLAER